MTNLVEKVELKLQEYGIQIFDHYEIENDEYTFIVEGMIIVVHKNMKDVSISFQVSTKPEIAANNTLILKEILEIKNINIMDSFAFTSEKKLVCGEQAYELLQKAIKQGVANDLEQSIIYKNILINQKGFEC